MRYFLPELHVQLNSPDDEVADAAEEAIDRASEEYNRRWAEIKPLMPPTVVRFYEEQFLHDADVFAPARLSATGPSPAGGEVIIVAQQINTLNAPTHDTLIFLHYAVTAEPRIEIPVRSRVFDPVQPIWLFDEFDMVEPGVFTHSILVSDGRVIVIPFRDFHYHLAKLLAPEVLRILGSVTPPETASA
jgi:hypothetical protein